VGRGSVIASFIASNHLDFVGLVETKKESFSSGFLKELDGNQRMGIRGWSFSSCSYLLWGQHEVF
jgi:hypothetical protein